MNTAKILLLTGHGASGRMAYHALAAKFDRVSVIREEAPSRAGLVRRRIRRLGARHVAGQLAFQTIVTPLLEWEGRARRQAILRESGLDESPIPEPYVHDVPSINHGSVSGLISQARPRAVAVVGTRIIARKILDAIEAPIFNLHVGITPAFRGVHGGYWALAEQRPELFGVTVHRVDAGIDTGRIGAQQTVLPSDEDNFATYPLLQFSIGIPLLVSVLEQAVGGAEPTSESLGGAESRLFYHPTAWHYLKTRFLYGVR